MLYIAVALTMLALVAGVLLLSKSKTDAMGAFAKWVSYAVIVISIGMLLCELGRCAMMCMHHERMEIREHGMRGIMYCPPEMCGGRACMMPMGRGGMNCCGMGSGMNGCNMGGGMNGCKGEMEHCKEGGKGKCCHEMEDNDDDAKKDSLKR